MEQRFTAFISYRHQSPDQEVAKWLHTAIETYHIPAAIKKQTGIRKMGKCFRDQEELPLSPSLGDDIEQRGEGAGDPCGLLPLRPGQQVSGLHAAACVAQKDLYAQALRQGAKLQIAPVTGRACGVARDAPGSGEQGAADEDQPDGLRLVVQEERRSKRGSLFQKCRRQS